MHDLKGALVASFFMSTINTMIYQKKILIIGYVFPEPNSSAAGSRMMQLIELFQEMQFEVVFASPAAPSEFQENLNSWGVTTHGIQLNDVSFDAFVRDLNPDFVLFDRFMMEEQFGWRVAENCPHAIRLLDTEDLHCLRSARQLAWKKEVAFEWDMLNSEIAKREIASIYRCDLTIMISEFELELLRDYFHVPSELVTYLPLFQAELTKEIQQKWLSFEDRTDFVFIGNFLHEPNWNATLYLKEIIWPLIHQALPGARLNIFGAYPSQKVYNLHNEKQGFLIRGRAQNAQEEVGKARVLLAPIRFGAGIKGKLLEAMIAGTPSVTTPIGAESIAGELDWNGFVESDPKLFAQKSIKLYQDKTCWENRQEKGISIIQNRFLKVHFESDFKLLLQELVRSIQPHRNRNFTGQMLLHHRLKSTKYMSLWISEKNKF